MKKTFHVHLDPKVVRIANDIDLELCVPAKNKVVIDVKDTGIPYTNGVLVGKGESEHLQSNIKDDKDCHKLKTYIKQNLVTTKYFSQYVDNKLVNVPHYFLMYYINESSANTPTYTEQSPGYGIPVTGHYKCLYEVLVSEDEYTRRFLFETRSVNISMYEWLKDLEENIEDLDNADDEIKSQFFKNEDDEWCFVMFDEVGLQTEVTVNTDEFLSMITSVRQLSCEFIDDKEPNI